MALEGLLPTLAQALDIRQVFKQVSEITQGVIPHDMLVLSLLQPDGASVGTHALLPGGELEELPTPSASLLALYRGALVRDITVVDPPTRTVKLFPLASHGEPLPALELSLDPVRSATLATLVSGPRWRCRCRFWAVAGGLGCSSRRPDAYGRSADLARHATSARPRPPEAGGGESEPWKRGWPRLASKVQSRSRRSNRSAATAVVGNRTPEAGREADGAGR
jgi:hypothetical protein